MFVCICNAIRESDFRCAARSCGGDASRVYSALGKNPQCCQCLDEANDILREERGSHFQTARAAA